MKLRTIASMTAALSLLCTVAFAQGPAVLITIDENGNGILSSGGNFPMPAALQADPGPGGLASTLTYDMLGPPSLVAGDLFLTEGVNGPILDVIRFNPAGTGGNANYPASIVFYSDNVGGFDSLGDTAGPPGAFYTNTVSMSEVGNEFFNGAVYTPTADQPGYVPGFAVTYDIISDVPEPSSIAFFAVGILGMAALAVKARRRRDLTA